LSALCARLCGAALWELVAATGFGTFSPFRQIGFVAVRIVSSLHCGGGTKTRPDMVNRALIGTMESTVDAEFGNQGTLSIGVLEPVAGQLWCPYMTKPSRSTSPSRPSRMKLRTTDQVMLSGATLIPS
jgi:hypothetical protein